MRKTTLILFYFFISLVVLAQEEHKEYLPKEKESRWAITLSGGATIIKIPKLFYPISVPHSLDNYKLFSRTKYNIDGCISYSFFRRNQLVVGYSYDFLGYTFRYRYQGSPVNSLDTVSVGYSFRCIYLLFQQGISYKKIGLNAGIGFQRATLFDNFDDDHGSNHYTIFHKMDFTNGKNVIELRLQGSIIYHVKKKFAISIMGDYVKSIKGIDEVRTDVFGHVYFYKFSPVYFKTNIGLTYNF